MGHTPPGVDDRRSSAAVLSERHNTKYLQLIRQYSDIIRGQFFGHWHSDTFRVVYSDTGTCVCEYVRVCCPFLLAIAWRWSAMNQPGWLDRCASTQTVFTLLRCAVRRVAASLSFFLRVASTAVTYIRFTLHFPRFCPDLAAAFLPGFNLTTRNFCPQTFNLRRIGMETKSAFVLSPSFHRDSSAMLFAAVITRPLYSRDFHPFDFSSFFLARSLLIRCISAFVHGGP